VLELVLELCCRNAAPLSISRFLLGLGSTHVQLEGHLLEPVLLLLLRLLYVVHPVIGLAAPPHVVHLAARLLRPGLRLLHGQARRVLLLATGRVRLQSPRVVFQRAVLLRKPPGVCLPVARCAARCEEDQWSASAAMSTSRHPEQLPNPRKALS
jgi:hypothetical protein